MYEKNDSFLFVCCCRNLQFLDAGNKTATVSRISFDQYLLLPVTPFASYGSLSYTATASPSPTVSSDQTQASCSQTTEVNVPNIGR